VKLIPLAIAGAYAIESDRIHDERGWFARAWDTAAFADAGLKGRFVQQSIAFNARAGTMRGMHIANHPAAETKIVRCVRGCIYDVIVDLRPRSASFRTFAAVLLGEGTTSALYIPAGCAHGYQSIVDDTTVLYDISEPYRPELAGGIAYDDPDLRIPWPLPVTVRSERDAALPSLERYLAANALEAVR
jgi:dTDP-4-dehydrorhamnose 3,5-epimerase